MTISRELAELAASYNSGGLAGMRNRIINGAMMIDQRNAGASVNSPASAAVLYTLDRWEVRGDTEGVYTIQQDTSSPAGFVNSLKTTVTTIDSSLGSAQLYNVSQKIEGTNVSDLAWGTADAKTVTLSFWVRSSLTGTFGGALRNYGSNRSYPFTYSISSANTWEYKTVTIAGDTSGTWLTTTGIGINVSFSLGAGSDRSGTAGAWNSNNNSSATGAVSVIGTLDATWYITGVQLEVGTVATSFDFRSYGTELALCQRYYYKLVVDNAGDNFDVGYAINTTSTTNLCFFPVTMRTGPTALEQSGTAGDYSVIETGAPITCSGVPTFNQASKNLARTTYTVASGLTAGRGSISRAVNTSAFLGWSAEL